MGAEAFDVTAAETCSTDSQALKKVSRYIGTKPLPPPLRVAGDVFAPAQKKSATTVYRLSHVGFKLHLVGQLK